MQHLLYCVLLDQGPVNDLCHLANKITANDQGSLPGFSGADA